MKKALSLIALLLTLCMLFGSCSILGGSEKILICSSCGAENPYSSKFCNECGALFNKKEDAPSENGGNQNGGNQNGNNDTNNDNWKENVQLLTETLVYRGTNHHYTEKYVYDANGTLQTKTVYVHGVTVDGFSGQTAIETKYTYSDSGSERVVKYLKEEYFYDYDTRFYEVHERTTLYDVYDEEGVKLYTTTLNPLVTQTMIAKQENTTEQGEGEFEGMTLQTTWTHLTNGAYYGESTMLKDGKRVGFMYQLFQNGKKSGSVYLYDNKNITTVYQIHSEHGLLLKFENSYDETGTLATRVVHEGRYQKRPAGMSPSPFPVTERSLGCSKDETICFGCSEVNQTYLYTYVKLSDYTPPAPDSSSDSGNNNGGNNGGGSNNNTNNGSPCEFCKQSGKLECSVCDGTGKVFSKFDEKGNKIMKTCINSKCLYGKVTCYYCNGDGIFGN